MQVTSYKIVTVVVVAALLELRVLFLLIRLVENKIVDMAPCLVQASKKSKRKVMLKHSF